MALSKGSWSPASGMKENWLVQVYETGSTTKFIGLSFFDQTCDSESYIGGIINVPSVREKINVFKSTSSLSNVNIECALGVAYVRSDGNASVANLAYELLFQGGRYYLNGTVKIFSSLSNDSDFDDVPQIYEGRLESMNHNADTLSLNVVAARPWDNLKFPNVYSAEKILAPIAYGNFTGNDSLYAGTGTDNWRPAIFTKADAASAYFTVGTVADSGLSKTSQYIPTRDGFVPFESTTTSTTTTGSVENVACGINGKYTYTSTPVSDAQTVSHTGWVESSIGQSYDLNSGTSGTYAYSEEIPENQSYNRIHTQRYTIPEVEAGAKIVLTYTISAYDRDPSAYNTLELVAKLSTADDEATSSAYSANAASDQSLTLTTSAVTTYVDLVLDAESDMLEGAAATVDMAVTLNAKSLSITNIKKDDKLEVVYTDADGENKNYRGLTTTLVANIHEAHRQFFHTYLGIDTDGTGSSDPDGWSDLDTDRAGWTIRGWIDKPMTAKQILDKLAFEGCFCYTWSASAGLKYIYVKDSYGSSNHSIDKNDVANVSSRHTPISELITDITVNYDRHPAKKEYRSQATAAESSVRGNYNIAANESKHTFNLDFLVAGIGSDLSPSGGTENDSFIGYLGQLSGKPRSIVTADVINPAYFGMELGDIVDFSGDMIPTSPFGKSFLAAYRYMVTGITRTSGKLSAEFIEVF